MNTVWIVENPTTLDQSLASALIGSYPVRIFANMESLKKVLTYNHTQTPTVIIIDLDTTSSAANIIEPVLQFFFADTAKIIVGGNGVDFEMDVLHLVRPLDDFEICKIVSSLVKKVRAKSLSHTKMRVRDISLDYSSLKYQTLPDGKPEDISLKEAQILKLLMEQRGKCVSRKTIQEQVWGSVCVSTRTIDSHISRLRKRLSYSSVSIDSIYGNGYILV